MNLPHQVLPRMFIVALLAWCRASAAVIELGPGIYREHAEVDVASRDLSGGGEWAKPGTTYAFLAVGHPTELARQQPVKLDEADVQRIVNEALMTKGFVPATQRDQVRVGVIVAYGTGVLPPPYAFFRTNPDFESYRTWPPALQRLHRLYYAGTADDDEVDRADTAEPVNYIKITGYDFALFAKEKKLRAVWSTLITMPSKAKPLTEHFARMVKLATPLLGTEARDGRVLEMQTPPGRVDLGTPQVVPPERPATPPAERKK
jgi:hypothetical protein